MGLSIPNRLGRKQGRFSSDYEVNEINAGLRGHQQAFGDEVDYYRFLREDSEMDDIYDEAAGVGRIYNGPIPIPALRVVHLEGSITNVDTGLYWNDELHLTLSFDQMGKVGLTKMDIEHQQYLRDRIVYDERVFTVTNVQILGQVQRRDVVVSIDATQVKGDELVNDPQWKRWSD